MEDCELKYTLSEIKLYKYNLTNFHYVKSQINNIISDSYYIKSPIFQAKVRRISKYR